MKPATAAKKLGILLGASPESFQAGAVTRSAFLELQSNPPEWLSALRREGPHPREVVARKLGVSTSGLARAGVTESLTTVQLKDLLETMPDWLVTERTRQVGVREENARIKSERAARADSS
ncbi:MAG: DUF5997 family protein [Salinibacterium sp.]|nr:DUF5997 family protein [Salinibacterium sp.]